MSDGGPNWLGLLKWTLAHTDGTAQSQFAEMSQDDKEWLEKVMKEGVKDEPARMNEIMTALTVIIDAKSFQDNEEKIEEMLQELRDIIEQIDMAQVFVKFGGVQCLICLLETNTLDSEVRSLAAATLGTLSQNNIAVQEEMFTMGLVDKLASLCLITESFSLCAKLVFAISCIVRNHAAAEVHFCQAFARAVFERALSSSNSAFSRRVVFLGNALLTSDTTTVERQRILAPCLVPACFSLVHSLDVDLREGTIRLLISFARTTVGRELFAQHADALDGALSLREEADIADTDWADQDAHEKRLIQEFRETLTQPVLAPMASVPTGQSSGLGNSNVPIPEPPPPPPTLGLEDTGGLPTPVLLLQPPPLTGASPPP